ncbi:MAG: UvrB/UvrC motif-containing protein [Planctomycetota bacterium]
MGLCERCKKAQATFHMTDIEVSGDKRERHLCEHCAVEEGLLQMAKPSVNIHDVLESFVASAKSSPSTLSNLVCSECGISYIEFRNQGSLGCPADYDVFEEHMERLLERAHDGNSHHVGKVPKSSGTRHMTQQDIHRLKRQLADAVSAEDYERAAELRDRIRELEGV